MMDRRLFLRGLITAPAVVAIGSLMPIRGIIMPRALGLGGSLTASEATALYAGLARSEAIQELIRGLKRDGIWDKLDRLWMLSVGTEAALTDIISGARMTRIQ